MLYFAFFAIFMFIANCEGMYKGFTVLYSIVLFSLIGTGYPINMPLSAIFDRLEKNELHMLTDEMVRAETVCLGTVRTNFFAGQGTQVFGFLVEVVPLLSKHDENAGDEISSPIIRLL